MLNRTAFVLLALICLIAGIIFITDRDSRRRLSPEVVAATAISHLASSLDTTAAEFLGSGTVKSVDRSDSTLRDAGYEKVRIKLLSGPNKLEWEILAPMAEAFQDGEPVNLLVFIHSEHNRSLNLPFYALVRPVPSQLQK
jgi:hypothetical protein